MLTQPHSNTKTSGRLSAPFAFLLAVIAVCTPPAAARDVPEAFWGFPDTAVAYWAVGEHPFGTEQTGALMTGAIRGLIANACAIEGGSSVPDAVLRAVGAAPFRVCLLELEGEPAAKNTRAIRPTKFGAILEVRIPAKDNGQQPILDAITAGLAADARDDKRAREQRDLELAGGLKGRISAAGDQASRDVSWVSTPDTVIVGIGRGAIERWIAARSTNQRQSSWWNQRNFVAQKRGRVPRLFEAFVDLNALRRGVPDEFLAGALGNLANAWGIPNARTMMVHGSFIPAERDSKTGLKLLAIDVSWSSRAEKPGTWKMLAITESAWPETLKSISKPADGWAIVARCNVPFWIELGTDTYESLDGGQPFANIKTRWTKRTAAAMERVIPRIGEWAVVSPAGIAIELKKSDGPDRLAADLRAVFSSMEPVVGFVQKSWVLRSDDEPRFTWKVADDENSIIGTWITDKK